MVDILTIYEFTRYFIASIVIVVVLFLAGLIFGRLAGKFSSKLLHELEINSIIKKTTKKSFNIEILVSKTISWTIYILFTILALNQMGITTPLLTWVAIIFAFLVVIGILFALKDHIPNFMAGIFLHRKKFFKVGDVIQVEDISGKVVSIGLLEVELEKEGDRIFIPNSIISKKKLSKKL